MQDHADPETRRCITWIDSQRLLQFAERLVQQTHMQIDNRQVVMSFLQILVLVQRKLKLLYRLLMREMIKRCPQVDTARKVSLGQVGAQPYRPFYCAKSLRLPVFFLRSV